MTNKPLQVDNGDVKVNPTGLVQSTTPSGSIDFKTTVVKNEKSIVITMTPERADELYKAHQRLNMEIGLRVYEKGAIYEEFLEKRGYYYNWNSLNEFVADLKCGRKTFFNYIRLYRLWKSVLARIFDLYPELIGIPHTRILDVIHHIEKAETDDEILEILHNAKELSSSDLALAYSKSKVILRFTDGNPYRITNKSKDRYDITISDCRIIWTQADGQVWQHIFRGSGRVKGHIEALDIKEMEE